MLIDLGFRNARARERLAAAVAALVPPAPRPKSERSLRTKNERSLRTKSERSLRTKRQRRLCLICCEGCWGVVAVAAHFAKPKRLPAS